MKHIVFGIPYRTLSSPVGRQGYVTARSTTYWIPRQGIKTIDWVIDGAVWTVVPLSWGEVVPEDEMNRDSAGNKWTWHITIASRIIGMPVVNCASPAGIIATFAGNLVKW